MKTQKKGDTGGCIGLLLACGLIWWIFKRYYVFLTVATVILIVVIILYKVFKEDKPTAPAKKSTTTSKKVVSNSYHKKKLMTKKEMDFHKKLQRVITEKAILVPQVCLGSVIDKNDTDEYRGELFRICDFGIFDTEYNLVALVEFNDDTHHDNENTKKRDKKVKAICNKAEIPLVSYWENFMDPSTKIKNPLPNGPKDICKHFHEELDPYNIDSYQYVKHPSFFSNSPR